MNTAHWLITSTYGFLTPNTPHVALAQTLQALLPAHQTAWRNVLAQGHLAADCAQLSLLPDLSDTLHTLPDETHLEMLFMLYGYAASAWIHGGKHQHLPANLSLTLNALAHYFDRPPMLGYAGMVLNNWRLKDPQVGFIPQNIELLLTFTDLIDESWFFRVHVAIEAQAGNILIALMDVQEFILANQQQRVLDYLRIMQRGLVQITKTFHEMPKLCDPDVYYQDVRPYLMSFDERIIFEGVTPNPTPLRGGSGAQSSIVPAMLAGLGIGHRESQLTANLQDMQHYMPIEHQLLIHDLQHSRLRDYCAQHPPLRDAYNHVLRHLITFRRAHLYYARTYIFEKSTNPVGTGGTEYMSFLRQLIDETSDQLL